MKKLLFVLAFTFIGQQTFSQMHIVMLTDLNPGHPSGCPSSLYDAVITQIDPTGNQTYECTEGGQQVFYGGDRVIKLNQIFNSLISQGYKMMPNSSGNLTGSGSQTGMWYFAIPWTSSGLEEVATTLTSFTISPNPANTFLDIYLDYSLKGENEVVFISEAGYIYHKEGIGNISKNEKYNIDISKIPAGKYLVTIVNGKTYTKPQKLVVF